MLRNQLKEKALPIESQAIEAYRVCVAKAYELGVYNQWSSRALLRLQQLRPENFTPLVEHFKPVEVDMPIQVQKNGLLIDDAGDLRPINLSGDSNLWLSTKQAANAPKGQAK